MEDVIVGSLLELSADYLVLCRESVEEMTEKYGKRKAATEGKGLRLNVGRTKAM